MRGKGVNLLGAGVLMAVIGAGAWAQIGGSAAERAARQTKQRLERPHAVEEAKITRETRDQLVHLLDGRLRMAVELSRYAAEHADTETVREFAAQVMREYGQVSKRLMKMIPGRHKGQPESALMQIQAEIERTQIESLKRYLEELEETEKSALARAYISHQVIAQLELADAMSVAEEYVSPPVAEVLRDTLPTVREKLARAKEIKRELD